MYLPGRPGSSEEGQVTALGQTTAQGAGGLGRGPGGRTGHRLELRVRDKQRGTRRLSGEGAPAHSPAPDGALLSDCQPGGEGRGGPGTKPGPSRSGQVREDCHSSILRGQRTSLEDGVDGQGSQSHPEAL